MKNEQLQRVGKMIDKIPYIIFFAAFFLLTVVSAYLSLRKADNGLYQDILRFHVIANSDSKEDQELKLMVKDTLLERMQELLLQADTKEESENILRENAAGLAALAQEVVEREGYTYQVEADITSCYFPVKQYAKLVLPAGEYEAFRVTIGSAEGKNWWCMLFPSLCFVDESYRVIPDEAVESMKNHLSEEEFNTIWNDRQTEVKVRFWLWEKLEKLFSGS